MAISTAIDPSVVGRIMGIKEQYKNLAPGGGFDLPQRIAVIAQGATASTFATTKKRVYTALEVGETYGFGSPVHLACLQLLPANGDGVGTIPVTVYPLDDDASGVAAAGDITPVLSSHALANYQAKIGGVLSLPFTVLAADAVADVIASMITAINAVPEMPVIASDGTTTLTLTSKWKGATANDITISMVGPTDKGATWTITDMASGATNPSVAGAISQIGQVWETMILNGMDDADETAMGLLAAEGESRWGATVMKPFISFHGSVSSTVALATAVTDTRKTDRTNVQLIAPGSADHPIVVAARQLARIAKVANNNPPVDYAGQKATGLTPGLDSVQWTHTMRDAAVKAGASTVEVVDEVVELSDTVTMFHPTGDPLPAYRYVVDIVKIQNIIYNMWLIFNQPEWQGAPLIPDSQPTTNPAAKKPKMAKAAVAGLIDGLALKAVLSNPETSKAGILAGINESNPKRLDVAVPVQLSGNTNIISIDLNWGFYFGTSPIVG